MRTVLGQLERRGRAGPAGRSSRGGPGPAQIAEQLDAKYQDRLPNGVKIRVGMQSVRILREPAPHVGQFALHRWHLWQACPALLPANARALWGSGGKSGGGCGGAVRRGLRWPV